MVDSDNDQLPDAFEMLVSKTNPHKYDSANDGVSDGEKMGVNGLPWELEQFRRSEAVIFASSNNATDGGACGQCVVYLPSRHRPVEKQFIIISVAWLFPAKNLP